MKNIVVVTVFLLMALMSSTAYSEDELNQGSYDGAYTACLDKLDDQLNSDNYYELFDQCMSEKGFADDSDIVDNEADFVEGEG